MATGSLILRDEHPRSLENPNLDRHLREAPVDGCTPFDSTDGDGKFKLRYEFKYNFGPKLDPKYNLEYKQDSPKPTPAPPTPQTPADKSSGSIGYVPNIATYKTVIGWKCASASATDTIPAIGLSAERPWKIDVGLITLDTTLSYSFAFKNGTSRDWVNKAIEYAGYPAKNLTIDEHAVGPVGSFGNLRLGGAEASTFPSTLTKLLSSDKESDRALGSLIHRGIVYGEEDGCVEIAPAPSWDPTHWPEDPVTSLPKTDVRLDE